MSAAPRRALLEHLSLTQIRSYEQLRLQLTDGLTVLTGPNGVGKTNLLEACAVVLSGTSPRTSSELRLIRGEEASGRIGASVRIDGDVHERAVVLRRGRGKQLRIDSRVAAGVAAFGERTPVAVFLPERLLIIRGAPQRRRALVDALASRTVPTAAHNLQQYAAALQQRNALLRRARAGQRVDDALEPWTQQLLEHATAVRHDRERLVQLLQEPIREHLDRLTGLDGGHLDTVLRGSGDLHRDAAETAAAERRRGTTLWGPHLDDLVPSASGRDLRTYGSAGEQRAALLALTFAGRDVTAAATGTEPVLLLDEPWSELDSDRRRRLTAAVGDVTQCIVTATEAPRHLRSMGVRATLLRVASGTVSPWDRHDHAEHDQPQRPA